MRDEPVDAVDALIDEAARRLVAGEPSSALRRSVRDRIDQRRPVWALLPVWGIAAAVLVAGVFAGRMFLGAPERSDSVIATGTPSNVKSATEQVPARAPTVIQPQPGDARQFSRRRATAVPLPLPEEEPLIPPITIEPLATAQIAVNESSGPIPIAIEPLQIEPLLGQ